MKPSVLRFIGLLILVTACRDSFTPTAVDVTPNASVTPTANSPCTVHWANGVSGSWFDATKWNPAGVPGSTSSVCIDAAGTYTVTMDPAVDATPIDILALDVGGAGAAATLNMSGTLATLNVGEGILVRAGATFHIRNSGRGVINAGNTITNSGAFGAIAPCGGCGMNDSINADILNLGTWNSTAGLTLAKMNGAYENSGTIDLGGGGNILIPAGAGNASFEFNAGSIVGTGNFGTLTMQAGTFTMNSGKARHRNSANDKPRIVIDGANLVLAATATDTVVVGVIAHQTASATVTGDIQPLTRLWLASPDSSQPGTITFAGNPTNAGIIYPATRIDASALAGVLTIGGAGRLTNTGTISQSKSSGSAATFHYALEITNNGTILTSDGTHLNFEKAGGLYENNDSISLGFNSSVMQLRVIGSTLTNTTGAKITGGAVHVDGGRLLGVSSINSSVVPLNGGSVEPGFSAGKLDVYQFRPATTGLLKIELGGATPGTEYDQLEATLSAFLQGTLDISEVNGFQVACGQAFDVVLHPMASGYGTFTNVTGLAPGSGRGLRIVYLNNTATSQGKVRLVAYDPGLKVCIGPNPVAIAEGGPSTQYAVTLGNAPTASVTVTATPNSQVTVTPASLTFTTSNWQQPQFFTVTAVDDNVFEGDHTGNVGHAVTSTDATYSGYAVAALTANITDNDNAPPVAVDDNAQTAAPNAVIVSVLTNDSDPDGQALTVTAVTQPANGSAQISGGGTTVTYTPNATFGGQDAFTYTISDGNGGTATGSVFVNVTAPNLAPIAVDDSRQTVTGNAVIVAVLANDSDPDSDPLTIASVTQPAHGTAQIDNVTQRVIYTPAAGYVGPDQFTYTVSDGRGGSATATVFITVNPPVPGNQPPIAVADNFSLGNGSSFNLNVLANDSDPDGDALRIVAVTQPNTGHMFSSNLSINRSGTSLTYTVQQCAVTPLGQFSYTVSDGRGGTATQSATFALQPPARDICLDSLVVSYTPGSTPGTYDLEVWTVWRPNGAWNGQRVAILVDYPNGLSSSQNGFCAPVGRNQCMHEITPILAFGGFGRARTPWRTVVSQSGNYRFTVSLVDPVTQRVFQDFDTRNNRSMSGSVRIP